jgi:hypothetical protein
MFNNIFQAFKQKNIKLTLLKYFSSNSFTLNFYRLYSICERKKRAQDAMAYNSLVQSWPEIQRIAQEPRKKETTQTVLFNLFNSRSDFFHF